MDDIKLLIAVDGCIVNGVPINHIYADDILVNAFGPTKMSLPNLSPK